MGFFTFPPAPGPPVGVAVADDAEADSVVSAVSVLVSPVSAPASGSGVFQPGIASRQVLTLILQGGGNSCTSASDFSHWTLVMQGPQANYTLLGDLVTSKQPL